MACIAGVLLAEMLKRLDLTSQFFYIDPSIMSVQNQLLAVLFELFGRNGDELAK